MYPEDNIFDLYRCLDKKVPFRVRRLHMVPAGKTIDDFRNTDSVTYVVEKVRPWKAYGEAHGHCLVDGIRDDNYVRSMYPDAPDGFIPCAGNGGWILIDQEDLDYIAARPKRGPEYILTFGQYKGKSLGEIAVENPGYIRWMMRKELINIDVDALSLGKKQ